MRCLLKLLLRIAQELRQLLIVRAVKCPALGRQLMAARVERLAEGIALGKPIALVPVPNILDVDYGILPTAGCYAPAPDGRKFLVARRKPDPNAPPLSALGELAFAGQPLICQCSAASKLAP
jgi:hypothetical protein